jgi:hypothetical protein
MNGVPVSKKGRIFISKPLISNSEPHIQNGETSFSPSTNSSNSEPHIQNDMKCSVSPFINPSNILENIQGNDVNIIVFQKNFKDQSNINRAVGKRKRKTKRKRR